MSLEDDPEAHGVSPETLRERAEDLPTSEELAVTDIVDDEFVAAHTAFDSFDELVAASPSEADSAEALSAAPDGAWDEFLATNSEFDDEAEFVMAARDHWVARELGLE